MCLILSGQRTDACIKHHFFIFFGFNLFRTHFLQSFITLIFAFSTILQFLKIPSGAQNQTLLTLCLKAHPTSVPSPPPNTLKKQNTKANLQSDFTYFKVSCPFSQNKTPPENDYISTYNLLISTPLCIFTCFLPIKS